MGFWETMAAAALGASVPVIAGWGLKTLGEEWWKRATPEGRGVARVEQIVGDALRRIGDADHHEPAD